MIAFHFPPLRGSSGIQRTLGFSRYLPELDWTPVVLAPGRRAYESIDSKQLSLIPQGLSIVRAFCLDAARHMSIRGRYPDFLALPDRWVSWVPGAVSKGLRTIKKQKISVIWSTYPIATSHVIGNILSKRTGIPWIADFRDPMVEWDPERQTYVPADPKILESRLHVEKQCVDNASALVFCTASARDICLDRYSSLDAEKCHVISNGYEEWSFVQAEKLVDSAARRDSNGVVHLLHSGTIYPTPDRDPSPFFDAIESLKRKNIVASSNLKITMRASGHDGFLRELLQKRGIEDIVKLEPPLAYFDALAEMMTVDGLLLFQGHTSNPAIPAKLYEYFRAGTPIFALLDSKGSTAKLMHGLAIGTVAPIIEAKAIESALIVFLQKVGQNNASIAQNEQVKCFARSELTRQLADLFESLSRPNFISQ
jgi:glycosyltransferase involved in cell wall biosynthesis